MVELEIIASVIDIVATGTKPSIVISTSLEARAAEAKSFNTLQQRSSKYVRASNSYRRC